MVAWRPMRRPGLGVSVATALLLAALFAGDSVWTAIAALLVAGGWSALALAGRAPQPGGGAVLLGLLLATAAWAGLSVAWSVAPDRSWAELNRTLVFAAFLVVGLLLGACGPRACRWAAAALVAALAAAVVWALAGKAIPALFPDGGRTARLRDPIGYWNALALAADMLLVLALQLAATGRSRAAVAGGAILAYAAGVAVLLAASRAGVAAAVLGVALWLWLWRDRVEARCSRSLPLIPAAALAAWAFSRPALVDDGYPRADRVADGAWFGLLLLAGACAGRAGRARAETTAALPAMLAGSPRASLAGLAIVAVLVAAVGAVAHAGRIADEFRGGEVTNSPDRFRSFSSNNRLEWWGEAWDIFKADPLVGAGANTFEVARKRYRETASPVTQPHSVPLQSLAGRGARRPGALRRARGRGGGSCGRGAPAARGRRTRCRRGPVRGARPLARARAGRLRLGLRRGDRARLLRRRSCLPPRDALRAPRRVRWPRSPRPPWRSPRPCRSSPRGWRTGASETSGLRSTAATLPLPSTLPTGRGHSTRCPSNPLFARARVEEARRDDEAALADVPRGGRAFSPRTRRRWYELGLYEFHLGDRCSAYVHLNQAYTLDPAGRQWVPGGPLDQARAWVNDGNC